METWPDERSHEVAGGWQSWNPPAEPFQIEIPCWSSRPPEGSWWRRLWWRWRRRQMGVVSLDREGVAWTEADASPVEVLGWSSPWRTRLSVWHISANWSELSVEMMRTGTAPRRVSLRVVLPQTEVSRHVEVKQGSAPYVSLDDFRRLWPVLSFHAQISGQDLSGMVGPSLSGWPSWDVKAGRGQARIADDPTPAWERMVKVYAGDFTMGSPIDEASRDRDEIGHEVHISRSLLVQATPVTQRQWKQLIGRRGFSPKFNGDDLPMESINWYQALAYCNERSRREGLEEAYIFKEPTGNPRDQDFEAAEVVWKGPECPGWRLLTEAEWEMACRANTVGARYGALDDVAWTRDTARGRTQKVGTLAPNAFGLFDMLGNVWEWCWDVYGRYDEQDWADPIGPMEGRTRVIRGAGWDNFGTLARAANRGNAEPDIADARIGLRCARTLIPDHEGKDTGSA